ncbi:MAG: diguanylate cyclase [Rhodocyclaceae bacterium]|nr:diguanylate cyclase [Rhodocyclaceae bacterium]
MSENAAEVPGPLPRVLIVDDSRIVRATIIKQIRGGFDVREEADGEAGWGALVIDPSVQVVISDLTMPRLDGYGLLQRIRASKITRIRELPVIMISGDEDESARIRAKELGATDFITKGTGTVELLTRLETVVKLAKAREALEETRDQVVVDPVTGLLSRALLLRQSEQGMARAQRHQEEMTVLVIGFDQMDELIDRHGPQIPDLLLTQFGRLLAQTMRKEDSLGRLAREEIGILCPGTPIRASSSFALRLRESVEVAAIKVQGKPIKVTVSVGIASNQVDGLDAGDAMLDLAQKRMRDAHAAGGNRVLGAGDMPVARRGPAPVPVESVDHALQQIAAGGSEALRPRLAAIALRLLPLLSLIDRHLGLGLPLADLERKIKSASPQQP